MTKRSVYRIRPLPLYTSVIDKSKMTYQMNIGEETMIAVYAWYIEGAESRILVDTGADTKLGAEVHAKRGTKSGQETTRHQVATFEDSLGRVGLRPQDIDLVIQTHLHWDHCANTFKCENAKVVVQEDELRFALAPHPLFLTTYFKSLFDGLRFVTVKGYSEILPGIELIPAPGHSPGIQAVAVNTEKGKAVITGFCSILDNFNPPEAIREMWPVIAPGLHTDAMQAFDSALKIKRLADILIPNHEPSFAEVDSVP